MQSSNVLHTVIVRRLLFWTLCTTMLLFFWGAAAAVEKVRNVDWDCSRSLEEPSRMHVTVTFDANLTALDVNTRSGSFSIPAHSTEGLLKYLAFVSVGPMDLQPPEGVDARFHLELSAICDESRVSFQPGSSPGFMTYVHPIEGKVVVGFTSETVRGAMDVGSGFWLSIRGSDGQSNQTQVLPGGKLGCASSAPEEAGSIGVFFDREGTVCHGSIVPGAPGKVYIIAKLAGTSASGVSGSEFRFTGVPDSWQTYAVPNPNLLALGDPFAGGVVAAFPCEQPETQTYILYTVVVTATRTEQDVTFSIAARDPPLNPLFTCPLFVGCDGPIFTKYCVQTEPCFVNPSSPTACDVSVRVTTRTWSGVKELFR